MKMFRHALLVASLSCLALAQTQKSAPPAAHPAAPATNPAKPSAEEVMKLLELMRVQDGLDITISAMKDQLKSSAEQALREKIANPTPEQIKAVRVIVDEEFKKMSLDGLLRGLVPVYQRHLTHQDVAALIAFYSSPAGRKIVREQPAMLRESMQATQAGQRQKMEDVLSRMDVRIQQLIIDEQNKGEPDRK
jgi:hypothetical protein